MSGPSGSRRARRARRPHLAVLVLAAAVAGCEVPNFEGPQIQEPPQGFLLTPESHPVRRLFPELPLAFHAGWVESVQDFSTLYVCGHPGVLGIEDAMAARDSARAHHADADVRFGEIEALRIDGREAWGWAERVESARRGLVSVAYRAIVPYDTITYAIEYYSGDPEFKRDAPESLKAVIGTFAIGRTTYNWPLIAIGAGLVVLAIGFVRQKKQERAARLRSINLVKIPKKKEGEAAAGAAPAGAAPAADPSATTVERPALKATAAFPAMTPRPATPARPAAPRPAQPPQPPKPGPSPGGQRPPDPRPPGAGAPKS